MRIFEDAQFTSGSALLPSNMRICCAAATKLTKPERDCMCFCGFANYFHGRNAANIIAALAVIYKANGDWMSGVTASHFMRNRNGRQLHVLSHRQPQDSDAVHVDFCNGFHRTTEYRLNARVMAHNVASEYNALTFDYTGHGRSEPLYPAERHPLGQTMNVSLGRCFSDARHVTKKYYENVTAQRILVGHSIGAWTAIILAFWENRINPGSILGVVAIAPTLGLVGPNGFVTTRLLNKPIKQLELRENGFVKSSLGADTRMVYPKPFLSHARHLDLIRNSRGEKRPLLPAPGFGITIIGGENDPAVSPIDYEDFAARFPKGCVEIKYQKAEPNPENPEKPRLAGHELDRESDIAAICAQIDVYAKRGQCMISGAALPQPRFN